MPSTLNLNGLKIYRPAVYAEVDASALGGQNPSTGNLALVGSFPTFEQNEPLTFTSASALVEYDASDRELAHIGKVAFSPSLDERVPAGVASLTLLNVTPNTQAQLVCVDANGDDALVFKSSVWGSKGNRTQVSLANVGVSVPAPLNVTVSRDGVVEEYEGIESGNVASVYYDGSLFSAVTLEASRDTGVLYSWSQSQAMSAGSASLDVSDMVSNATLSVSLSSTAHTASVVVTIVGLDLAGAALTQVKTFSAGVNTAQTTSAFSSISSISATTTHTAYTGSVQVSGSLNLAPADYSSLRELVSALDNLPHVVASYLAGKEYEADDFDLLASSNIEGESYLVILRCDAAEILSALAGSRLVSVERATGGVASVEQQTEGGSLTSLMSGGASSATTLSHWTAALALIESSDLQILVPWSDDVSVFGAVKAHLRLAALAGRERNAWLGAQGSQSLTALHAITKSLNDRNLALVGQQIKHIDPQGVTRTLEPKWLALMLASMQAGTPVATPLTRKEPNIVDSLQLWDANRDAGEAISKGVCVLSRGPLGWRVERSVTTWLRDDNPIYSEVSANESINASVRDLRGALDPFIGVGNVGLTAARLTGIVTARLNRQVLDGVIKAFKDVVLEDLGDTVRVNYTVAAVEPLNFIRITASVARF